MENYFSVLPWITNMDYDPSAVQDVRNALIPISKDLDIKIGERILPNYNLLWDLHTACVRWIKTERDYQDNYAKEDEYNLDLRVRDILDIYERIDSKTYIKWFLTSDDCNIISDRDSYYYKEYKENYLNTILTGSKQEDNLQFFYKECNVLARIEVKDIIYDFINHRKVYILNMKSFQY